MKLKLDELKSGLSVRASLIARGIIKENPNAVQISLYCQRCHAEFTRLTSRPWDGICGTCHLTKRGNKK